MPRTPKAPAARRARPPREAKVLAQGDFLPAILDSLSSQIVVIDGEGNVLLANRAWRSLLGSEQSAAIGDDGPQENYLATCQRALEAGHPAAAQILETIRAVLGGKAVAGRAEYRGASSNGRDRWFSLAVTPLDDRAGAVLMHEDVSLQHFMEGEILELSERERSQVGQELHDGLCQHLGGVALLAKTLSNSLAAAGRPEAPQAAELAQLIYSAVGETRSVARGLRPVELDEDGLLAALQDLAEQARQRIRCELQTHGEPRVASNEVATNLYRIAREAVHNAVKHSGANRLTIRLRQAAHQLTLSVEDDGCGITKESAMAEGMGLRTMRYRANAIGAWIEISNRVTRGLLVRCSVPQRAPGPPAR